MNENRVVTVEEQTALALSVLRFGEAHGRTFKPVPYRGLLVEPFADDEFVYRRARDMPEDFEMPMEAWRRFFMVYENFPVMDAIIAEEIEPYKELQRAKEISTGVAVGVAVASVLDIGEDNIVSSPSVAGRS